MHNALDCKGATDPEGIEAKTAGVFIAGLPRDALGRRLFGDRSPDLELEGKRKDTRHKFRHVRAAGIA